MKLTCIWNSHVNKSVIALSFCLTEAFTIIIIIIIIVIISNLQTSKYMKINSWNMQKILHYKNDTCDRFKGSNPIQQCGSPLTFNIFGHI